MHPTHKLTRFVLPLGLALILAACGSGGAGWTFAPLGPTPLVSPSTAPTSAPTGSPDGSAGPGVTLEVKTTDAAPLVFEPNVLEAPPATQATVNYLNDSSIPHNINFFAGQDQSSPSIGATAVVTGPGALESVTFTTPGQPGDYLFWCDIHGSGMVGTLRVVP